MTDFHKHKSAQGQKILSVIGFALNCLILVVSVAGIFLGTVGSFKSLSAAGAPDTNLLSRSIVISVYCSFSLMGLIIIASVFHFIVVRHSMFLRPWMWWMLFCAALFTVLFAIFPFSPVTLLFGAGYLILSFIHRPFYYDNNQPAG